ncbi:MAG: MarR family transcriptional regulator [Holophagaceae bacterium]|uniref:MarR family transcriptional regulator n=1 Tax=Candidatus Geothrix skivensis TaxID=2954439 RepID=A0A9D7SFX5_9BACT|nr:MarR family transcriptional regulator [Candidatus Geothrix skivensis]
MKRPLSRKSPSRAPTTPWTFLSNHAHVLICLAQEPTLRIQDLADRVGITYRAVQRILDELEAEGYLSRSRRQDDARSNEYRVNLDLPLRHPIEQHQRIAALLALGKVR